MAMKQAREQKFFLEDATMSSRHQIAGFTTRWAPTTVRIGICLGLAMIVALGACKSEQSEQSEQLAAEKPAAEAPRAEADEEPEPYHSPFLVEIQGGPFDRATFKDVGLERGDGEEPDAMLLEAIAESFALDMQSHTELEADAEVHYDENIAEPDNHLHCEIDHLYVDLWQGESPERWGYSLWSGCSELDNFVWREVPFEKGADVLPESVAPLTDSIVESLAKAAHRGCFQKNC